MFQDHEYSHHTHTLINMDMQTARATMMEKKHRRQLKKNDHGDDDDSRDSIKILFRFFVAFFLFIQIDWLILHIFLAQSFFPIVQSFIWQFYSRLKLIKWRRILKKNWKKYFRIFQFLTVKFSSSFFYWFQIKFHNQSENQWWWSNNKVVVFIDFFPSINFSSVFWKDCLTIHSVQQTNVEKNMTWIPYSHFTDWPWMTLLSPGSFVHHRHHHHHHQQQQTK